jgi:hypothetical protein
MQFKQLLIFVVIFFFSTQIFTQKFVVSYFETLNFSSTNSISGKQNKVIYNNEQSMSTIRGSLGSGLSSAISLNLSPKENLVLGLNYMFFNSFENTKELISTNTSSFESKIKAKQHLLCPSIQFKLPYEKIAFMMKTGLIIPLKTISYQTTNDNFTDGINTFKIDEIFDYNFSVGFNCAMGFEIKILKKLYLQTFLTSNLFSQTLKSKKTKQYLQNDIDVTNLLNTYQKESIYHEDINNFSNNEIINQDFKTEKPRDELTESQSFNSIGLSLGICYKFNLAKKNKK